MSGLILIILGTGCTMGPASIPPTPTAQETAGHDTAAEPTSSTGDSAPLGTTADTATTADTGWSTPSGDTVALGPTGDTGGPATGDTGSMTTTTRLLTGITGDTGVVGATTADTSPGSPTADTGAIVATADTAVLAPTGDTGSPGATADTAATITGGPTGGAQTADTGGGATALGSCSASSHPLVFECHFELPAAAPLTLQVTSPSASDRTFSSGRAVVHDVLAWGLQPDTAYDWSAAGLTGSFRTGPLPPGLANLTVTREGGGSLFGVDAVLTHVGCSYFVMIEEDGDVVWFTDSSVFHHLSDGMMWSQQDRTMLALTDSAMGPGPSVFEERDLLGDLVLRLEPGTHFALRLTHDVGRWRGYTYLLGETNAGVGGFEVFQGTTKVGQWLLTDAFPNIGISHVNGLTVSETGQVILSEHASDTIIAVDGNPMSPTFLVKRWHASGGTPAALPNPNYLPYVGVLFRQQHNASRHGDELWVFDNSSQPTSRALRMSMNHLTGELTELDSWSMGDSCRVQGGAMPIPGGVLATCTNNTRILAFRDGSAVADWGIRPSCNGSDSTRGFPVVIE